MHPADWHDIELVAFDVDGTLYDQRRLRLRMARDLLAHALRRREVECISVIRAYRRVRERLGEQEIEDFEGPLITQTAAITGRSPEAVRRIVGEWIERRPLPHLARCRYAGVRELFAGLRRKGKVIGVLSDYPASEKLQALGLTADRVVTSGQEGVGVLKPHPRGLEALMRAAGVGPRATVLIGDRVERDGLAARRAGARALIRSLKRRAGWRTFTRYDEPLFAPFLTP